MVAIEDLAVAHVEDTVGDGGGLGVVGDHEDGLVEIAAGASEHVEDGVGVLGVQVTGGLVGKHDGGMGDEGAGDGDALLLTAGELVGTVVEAAGKAEEASEVVEKRAVEGLAGFGDVVRDLDIAHGGEGGQEIEALEDEADAGATEPGALRVGEPGELGAFDRNGAGGGLGEAAEDVEEGGFAGAGRSDDGDELAGHPRKDRRCGGRGQRACRSDRSCRGREPR